MRVCEVGIEYVHTFEAQTERNNTSLPTVKLFIIRCVWNVQSRRASKYYCDQERGQAQKCIYISIALILGLIVGVAAECPPQFLGTDPRRCQSQSSCRRSCLDRSSSKPPNSSFSCSVSCDQTVTCSRRS